MILTRTREHRFNMGPYEHLLISATVQIDADELPSGADPVTVASELLDKALQEDIDRADQVSTTPEDETYLHGWKDIL